MIIALVRRRVGIEFINCSVLFSDTYVLLAAVVVDGDGLCAHDDDVEASLLQHAGIGALALAYGECAGVVIPLEGDGAVCTVLVSIAVALILVEGKGAVGTRVYANLEVVPRLLTNVLRKSR